MQRRRTAFACFHLRQWEMLGCLKAIRGVVGRSQFALSLSHKRMAWHHRVSKIYLPNARPVAPCHQTIEPKKRLACIRAIHHLRLR